MKSTNARSGARQEAPAGIVEKRPWKALPPGLKNRLECTAVEMRAQPVLEKIDDAGAGECCRDCKIGGRPDLYEERSGRIDLHDLSVALKLPGRHCAAGEAAAQAGMLQQFARVMRPAVTIKIGGRCRSGEALDARPDRHRDHVFFQSLAVANSRVAPGRQDIDKAIVGDHLQFDVWISGKERRNDRGKRQAHRADRDIEPQRPGWSAAKTIHHVEG